MLRNIPCFWIEAIERAALFLRRYSLDSGPCPAGDRSYHDAIAYYGVTDAKLDYKDPVRIHVSGPSAFLRVPQSDSRWPTKCDHCDYVFKPEDQYQAGAKDIYRSPLTGEEKRLGEWGAGAVYDAWWDRDEAHATPDGRSIVVLLPDSLGRTRMWQPDIANSSGRPWQRTGDPAKDIRTLTVRPSIVATNHPRFHAWLTNGVLEVLPDTEPWE